MLQRMVFEDLLSSAPPIYRYKGYRECIELLEKEHDKFEHEEDPLKDAYSPYFIMEIDERSFLEYFVNSNNKLLTLSWEIYDHAYQSALFRMESAEHATASSAFDSIFSAWTRTVSKHSLAGTRTHTFRGATRTKRADISWTLKQMPPGRSEWPTVVGEVVWSEPRSKLKADMEFWLNDPASSVNVALTISVLRGRILMERWKSVDNKPPSPVQKMEIVRKPKLGCPRVTGQLEIKFSEVFLREPKPNTLERDFSFTEADMEELADDVWSFQYKTKPAQ